MKTLFSAEPFVSLLYGLCCFLFSVDHSFEIVIEGVRGLQLFDNMIWGEADCFVQYHFPVQVETRPPGAPVIMHGKWNSVMKGAILH